MNLEEYNKKIRREKYVSITVLFFIFLILGVIMSIFIQ